MTPEVLTFLRDLVAVQRLNAGAHDFAETARIVVQALADLDAAIADTDAVATRP